MRFRQMPSNKSFKPNSNRYAITVGLILVLGPVTQSMSDLHKNCRRCGRPVVVHADHYDVFEGMHWLCFHLEFEHDTDPDEACADPGCPWSELKIYRDKLSELGLSPDKVIEAAIQGLPYPPSDGA